MYLADFADKGEETPSTLAVISQKSKNLGQQKIRTEAILICQTLVVTQILNCMYLADLELDGS